jgi:hypothetical protein
MEDIVCRHLKAKILDILYEKNKPMHYKDITAILQNNGIVFHGKTPALSVNSILTRANNEFERIGRGKYQIYTGKQQFKKRKK